MLGSRRSKDLVHVGVGHGMEHQAALPYTRRQRADARDTSEEHFSSDLARLSPYEARNEKQKDLQEHELPCWLTGEVTSSSLNMDDTSRKPLISCCSLSKAVLAFLMWLTIITSVCPWGHRANDSY